MVRESLWFLLQWLQSTGDAGFEIWQSSWLFLSFSFFIHSHFFTAKHNLITVSWLTKLLDTLTFSAKLDRHKTWLHMENRTDNLSTFLEPRRCMHNFHIIWTAQLKYLVIASQWVKGMSSYQCNYRVCNTQKGH